MNKKYGLLRVNKADNNDYGLCFLDCNDSNREVMGGEGQWDSTDVVEKTRMECHYDKLSHNLEAVKKERENMVELWGHEEDYFVVELVAVSE